MKLYINCENGQPISHPAFEENLIQAFGSVPNDWEPFIRVERPIPGVYEILESEEPVYAKVNGVWTDVWSLRPMTGEEVITKQQSAKEHWAAQQQPENWADWVFNSETCQYDPPI